MPVFTFEFKGLSGWILKDEASTSYSLMDLGLELPYKTYDPNGFGIRFLQTLYFIFTIAIPFSFLVLMFILYVKPLKLNIQKKLFVYAEILYAWSSVDVLTLAMISSLFEIR